METSRRMTDELGSRVERPIHFECKLNEPMHIGMRLLHPAAADHSMSISRPGAGCSATFGCLGNGRARQGLQYGLSGTVFSKPT